MIRREAAFAFIPELIGDFSHTMELSGDSRLLYIETAVTSLHMANDVINSIVEHINTKKKEETKHTLKEDYKELIRIKTEHYVQETVQNIDITYEKLKIKIRDGKLRDTEVRAFIRCLGDELNKVNDIFNNIKDLEGLKRDNLEEIMRKTIRAYNNLLKIYIEEV